MPAPSGPRPAPTGSQPTVTRSQGARHTAPPPAPLGLRFRALLGLGFVPPPEPRPCAHCASIAYALLPAARVPLYRHRADPESSSRSLPSGSPARTRPPHAAIRIPLCRHRADPARIAPPIAPTARRRPHRAHRAPTSASPPISLLALRRPRGPGWQEPRRMHPFFAECAKKAPFLATSARNACFSRSRWQHPRPMHPFPGAIGRFRIHGARILPPRALFRVEEPEITHGAKMLPAPPGLSPEAACGPTERALCHAAAACDTRHGRTGFAPCGAGLACLPHAPLPVISLVPAAACAPCHLARVHRRRLTRVVLRCPHRAHRAPPSAASPIAVGVSRLSGSSRRPRAVHADASRPPMRARRHRPSPNPRPPRQPSPAHPWSRLRPPAPCHPLHLALPRGSRCGSGNSCEMVR